MLTAFNCAKRAGRWEGPNPAKEVQRRRAPKGKPEFLRLREVPLVLQAVSKRWQPLFATAIYTGLRKGELLGLCKSDVDFSTGLITVARSYDHDSTKGGHADAIPIAGELVPYLRAAIAASPSDVFPDADGSMLSRHTPLEEVLRRALAHAGIVTAYVHVCRKKGCGHKETAQDAQLRHCPGHGMKLWLKAQVRQIRFHDLRHTTGSLLLMAGAKPAAVQRILRHSAPRITTEVYGHLLPGYLRSEIDKLAFEPKAAATDGKGSQAAAPVAKNKRNPSGFLQRGLAGWTGLEPLEAETEKPVASRGLVRKCREVSRGSGRGEVAASCGRFPPRAAEFPAVVANGCQRTKRLPGRRTTGRMHSRYPNRASHRRLANRQTGASACVLRQPAALKPPTGTFVFAHQDTIVGSPGRSAGVFDRFPSIHAVSDILEHRRPSA